MIHDSHRYFVLFPSIFCQYHCLLIKCTTYWHILAHPCLRTTPLLSGHFARGFSIAWTCSIILRRIHDYQRIEDFKTTTCQLLFYNSVRIRNEIVLWRLGCLEHWSSSGPLSSSRWRGWYHWCLNHKGYEIIIIFLFARWRSLKSRRCGDSEMRHGV